MRLDRSTIPQPLDPYPGSSIRLAVGFADDGRPVSLRFEPRELDGADTMTLMAAFDKACARIWGQHWQGSLELVCDLRKGTARKWVKDGQIPPPMIVAWVAYLCARDDARVMGRMLEALALSGITGGDTVSSFKAASCAFVGLRG